MYKNNQGKYYVVNPLLRVVLYVDIKQMQGFIYLLNETIQPLILSELYFRINNPVVSIQRFAVGDQLLLTQYLSTTENIFNIQKMRTEFIIAICYYLVYILVYNLQS